MRDLDGPVAIASLDSLGKLLVGFEILERRSWRTGEESVEEERPVSPLVVVWSP